MSQLNRRFNDKTNWILVFASAVFWYAMQVICHILIFFDFVQLNEQLIALSLLLVGFNSSFFILLLYIMYKVRVKK